jgi:small-conductance mechanosensitive channel
MMKNRKYQGGLFLLFVLCICSLFTNNLSAQKGNDVDPKIAGIQLDISPVKLDGTLLFYVRGISSYPSSQRAETITGRIKKAADNSDISADSIKTIPDKDVIQIYAGTEFIMNIYPVDAEVEGINQSALSGLIIAKTHEGIVKYRSDRSRPVLIKKMLFAFGATLLLIAIMFFFIWLIRRINIAIQNKLKSRIDSLENKSYKLIRSDQFWKLFNIFFKTLKILTIVVIIIVFIEYILGLFPWTNNFAVSVLEIFLVPLKSIGSGFIGYLPSLVFLIIIILITWYLLKLIRLLFTGIKKGAIVINKFYPEWAMPTFKIIRIFVIAFAVILAYQYIPGSGSAAFKGVSVFLGVLFSLGSSSFIGNIIAGYTVTYRRTFKIGDLIEVNNHIGFVEEQKLQVTRLRSHKNEEIIIPNSLLINSNIINYSSSENEKGLILHTTVGIGYETPWRLVDAMLKMAADRTEGLSKEPPPFVLRNSLGDFAVNYELNVYCKDVAGIKKHYTVLHQNILDVFNENNVQIMTPAYERDPAEPKVVPKDQWDTPLSGQ